MIRNQVNNTNQDLYMRVSLDKAVKAIYSNVKLEQIINEAIANSIDANATSIQIEITGKLPSSKNGNIQNLGITIKDNGNGFTEQSLKRFITLYDPQDDFHKGVGRLAFKRAFKKVQIESVNVNNGEVEFEFNDKLELEKIKNNDGSNKEQCTVISLSDPVSDIQNIKTSNFSKEYLKNAVLKEFFVTLLSLKQNKKDITISITTNFVEENSLNKRTPIHNFNHMR